MNTHRAIALVLGFSVVPAGAGLAQPIELMVDPAQSSISVDVELVTPIGTQSSMDSSPVEGTATIELDDTSAPTSITLADYAFTAQQDLDFAYSFGFLGTVTGVGSGLGLRQPTGSPPTTGPVDGLGAFSLLGVPNQPVGAIDASGTGVIGGTIGMVSIELGTLDPTIVDATGTVVVAGDQVTVTVTVPISTSQDAGSGVIANITGSASVVATGTIPAEDCPADVNGDGELTPGDFNSWILAFNTQSPECDQNGDGSCSPGDFNAWILNFNGGC
ncbi:MAG: GC-type dockerin domain-anchored protein [Planctomycetota bacterium]